MKHDHEDPCKHILKWCEKCEVPYCSKCSMEWGGICTTPHYYPWWGTGDDFRYITTYGTGTGDDLRFPATSISTRTSNFTFDDAVIPTIHNHIEG